MGTKRTYLTGDELVLDDFSAEPAFQGMLTLNSGNYRWYDAIGVFNPRDYWSNLVDGPADNWAATLYEVVTYVTGTPFFSQVAWYTDSAKSKPVVIQVYTYSGTAYTTPTQVKWTLYGPAGTVIHTCTDVITYTTGTPFEASRVRTLT